MIDAGTPGAINWVDLSTPDIKAATSFYRDLFGWSIERQATPMGEYFVAGVGGHEVAGMMEQGPALKGSPPMWTTFVSVEGIDDMCARVVDAGGAVLQHPFDIPGDARVAVFADPTGAMLAMIEGPKPEGTYFSGETGAVCWVELLTRDPAAAEGFYTAVFGWKAVTEATQGMAYTVFKLDDQDFAGMMMMPQEVPAEAPAHWMVYFAVSDCAAFEQKAAALGGQVLHSTTDIEVGKFAVLADPQGATFHLLESTKLSP